MEVFLLEKYWYFCDLILTEIFVLNRRNCCMVLKNSNCLKATFQLNLINLHSKSIYPMQVIKLQIPTVFHHIKWHKANKKLILLPSFHSSRTVSWRIFFFIQTQFVSEIDMQVSEKCQRRAWKIECGYRQKIYVFFYFYMKLVFCASIVRANTVKTAWNEMRQCWLIVPLLSEWYWRWMLQFFSISMVYLSRHFTFSYSDCYSIDSLLLSAC